MSFLPTNKDFERENIQKLQQQIGLLGYANPVLVVFGRDAETIARRNPRNELFISQNSYGEGSANGRFSHWIVRSEVLQVTDDGLW